MTTPLTFTPDQLVARATFAEPYPVYHALRDHSPVHYVSIPGGGASGLAAPIRAWGFLRYDDVYGALRDHETFSSENLMAGRFGPQIVLIQDDPPRHTRFRRLV